MYKTRKNLSRAVCLAGLAFTATTHADNLWLNSSGNFLWDETSNNWLSPTKWLEGDNAIFGGAGSGIVTLGVGVNPANVTFNGDALSYAIVGNGYSLTLGNGVNPAIITENTTAILAASIAGAGGVNFTGGGTTTLLGDTNTLVANTYSGGTRILGGTVILRALNATAGGLNYGVDSIEQLDAGATVKIGVIDNGPGLVTDMPKGQIGLSTSVPSHLHLTGGTLDLNGWSRNNGNTQVPCPDGTGLIVNNSSNVQSALIIVGDGQNHEFAGQINDGGPLRITGTDSYNDKGYQLGILDLHYGIGGYVLTLSGSNSYSGSTRFGNASIKMSGAGTLGIPSTISGVTGPMRIYGPNYLDLNGTSQTIGAIANVSPAGSIFNSAAGTVSTLNLGFGPNANATSTAMIDSPAGTAGGQLAVNYVGTAQQGLTGLNTYSGDTTVTGSGVLAFTTTTGVSPNTGFKLASAGPGHVNLGYSGDVNVRSLYLDGVRMPDGTYGASTAPFTGSGTIDVTPFTWNGAGSSLWNNEDFNWGSASPAIGASSPWYFGREAVFGATGAGAITLSDPIGVYSMTFNAAGYTINGGSLPLTLIDPGANITANAAVTIAASLQGNVGLTIKGTNSVTLAGDAAGSANQYTGGTFVKGGTVILQAANVFTATSGHSFAVDSIQQLDAGATVQIGTVNTGSANQPPVNGQIGNNTAFPIRLNLTGGTFDNNGDNNSIVYPYPEGTGTILNSSPYIRGVLKLQGAGGTYTFSGHIKDGATTVLTSQGVGYQENIDCNSGTATLVLAGSNSFSGYLRINGQTVIMSGAGTMGYPTPINCPSRQIIHNSGTLDLNGTSQKTGVFYTGSGASVINSAVGTTSTLFLCFNATNQTVPSQGGFSCNLQDTPGTTGLIGLTMAGGTPLTIQSISGVNNTYHGDTVVSNGILRFDKTGSVSPNSTIRLFASHGNLALNYTGTATVNRLIIDGAEMPNGTYGSTTAPISGTGFLQVIASQGRPTLGYSTTVTAGGTQNFVFNWSGSYKLQAQTNSLTSSWHDYPGGGTSPLTVPIDHSNKDVFFRLAPLP